MCFRHLCLPLVSESTFLNDMPRLLLCQEKKKAKLTPTDFSHLPLKPPLGLFVHSWVLIEIKDELSRRLLIADPQ